MQMIHPALLTRISICLRDAHWRRETDRLSPQTTLTDQQAKVTGLFQNRRTFSRGRRLCHAIFDHLDADIKPWPRTSPITLCFSFNLAKPA